jgi:hypothetical protein
MTMKIISAIVSVLLLGCIVGVYAPPPETLPKKEATLDTLHSSLAVLVSHAPAFMAALENHAASNAASMELLVSHAATNAYSMAALETHAASNAASMELLVSHAATNANSMAALETHAASNAASMELLVSHAASNANSMATLVSHAPAFMAVLEANAASNDLLANSMAALVSHAASQANSTTVIASSLALLASNANSTADSIDAFFPLRKVPPRSLYYFRLLVTLLTSVSIVWVFLPHGLKNQMLRWILDITLKGNPEAREAYKQLVIDAVAKTEAREAGEIEAPQETDEEIAEVVAAEDGGENDTEAHQAGGGEATGDNGVVPANRAEDEVI